MLAKSMQGLHCTARLCPRNVTTACILFPLIFLLSTLFSLMFWLNSKKGQEGCQQPTLLEQFLKEGNGGNLRQKAEQYLKHMIFLQQLLDPECNCFGFNHLILFINWNFLIPRFYSLYIFGYLYWYMFMLGSICVCECVYVCLCL